MSSDRDTQSASELANARHTRAAAAREPAQGLGAARAELVRELDVLTGEHALLVAALRDQRVELRAAVTRYAALLRDTGAPPERMLIEVKGAVPLALIASGDGDAARSLVDHVVRWSIEAYYAPDGA